MIITKEMIEAGAIALCDYDAPNSSQNWQTVYNKDRQALEAAYRRRAEACLKAALKDFK